MGPRHRSAATVAIIGAGPAGLMLSHLLARDGIDSVAIDIRERAKIEETHRAGILEADSVRLLVDSGVSDRVLIDGNEHQGIELAFGGAGNRIDFTQLAGASTWLYPQTNVFIDLANARHRDGGDVRFGVSDVSVLEPTSTSPGFAFTDSNGIEHEVRCGYLVGTDGSRSICRFVIPEAERRQYFREYPFAWFGTLCEAPKSSPELIYNYSERGFALIRHRTETLQRMYFQCDPNEDVDAWSDSRIWTELQSRLGGNGYSWQEGPITSKTVLPFRSFVQEPMHGGRVVLAGDAAHTVPPTGAKGLNLALADVRVLAECLERAVRKNDAEVLAEYGDRTLKRAWKAQHFSYWMTTMLHHLPAATDFDHRRQLGELESVVTSTAGSTYLAEHTQVGPPDDRRAAGLSSSSAATLL
jgi:4-hydroxybenzoate 3-monooxygenase